jgi:hypothetical protein
MSPIKSHAFSTIRHVSKVLLAIILLAGLFLPYHSSMASSVPTFDVASVISNDSVTLQTHHYPAEQTFTVRMGEYGTLGVDGIVVGSFDSGAGGDFSVSFDIPDALQDLSRIAIRADSSDGYFSYNWFYNKAAAASTDSSEPAATSFSGTPTMGILDVVIDDQVTIRTRQYPPGQTFTVRMGKYGTLGIDGVVVGKFDSGNGGSMDKTFDIPDELHGQSRIAIRADSPAGFFSYNWFWNATLSGKLTPAGPKGYTGIPTFKILDVDKDDKVKIRTTNFPAGLTFKVLMGAYGSLGVGGIEVGSTDSGDGGSFDKTYDIPDALHGKSRIAIRLESTSGFYAYNWFWNKSTKSSSSSDSSSDKSDSSSDAKTTPTYFGIPTFSISEVDHDSAVTVDTHNFPADQTFTVRMGEYGTLAIGGIEVGSTDSGDGGSFTTKYSIPDALKGNQRIAIRMDSGAGFFAYNWFWNNSTK